MNYLIENSFKCSANKLSEFFIRIGNGSDSTENFEPESYAECWYQSSALRDNETKLFKCDDALMGRYVVIHFEASKTERLQLCEVVVYQETGN